MVILWDFIHSLQISSLKLNYSLKVQPCFGVISLMRQSIPRPPIPPPPRANPGHLTRVKLCTVGNLTQNEARPVGHLTFVSKRLSAVGNKRISQFFDSACAPRSRVIALVDSTWVFLLLSFYICISWNMPLFKVWSDDKLKKKFVVAENFAELVSKGKRFCLYSFFMSAWRDRMLHATSDLADQYS